MPLRFNRPARLQTTTGQHRLQLAIASNAWQRFRGLMLAPPLLLGQALLLRPCASVHSFFMRYPLDIVYLSANNIVTHTCTLKPWRASLGRSFQGARTAQTLEMPLGAVARLGIQAGDRLVYES